MDALCKAQTATGIPCQEKSTDDAHGASVLYSFAEDATGEEIDDIAALTSGSFPCREARERLEEAIVLNPVGLASLLRQMTRSDDMSSNRVGLVMEI